MSKKAHIASVLGEAHRGLKKWIGGGRQLCDLTKDFQKGRYPYHLPHAQFYYQLRFYHAYFLENYMMFRMLEDEFDDPYIVSIGCGCMVDAAAASFVFENIYYDGYDKVNWKVKAVDTDRDIDFYNIDVCELAEFHRNVDIFNFSRSLGDIGFKVSELRTAIVNTKFSSDKLYITATCVPDVKGDFQLRRLEEFASYFEGFSVEVLKKFPDDEDRLVYRQDRFEDHYDWCVNGYGAYCTTLLDKCTRDRDDRCDGVECEKMNKYPMGRFNNIGFAILKLSR